MIFVDCSCEVYLRHDAQYDICGLKNIQFVNSYYMKILKITPDINM